MGARYGPSSGRQDRFIRALSGASPVNAEALSALPGIPRDDTGPLFNEPWEAQAFAMAVALHAKGLFSWREWAEALSREIKAAELSPCHDAGTAYYTHWLAALEGLVIANTAATAQTLSDLQAKWDRAARATPHGKPIELTNDPEA